MKIDFGALFKGAVYIEITGRFSERFLNLAFQEGIELRHIERRGDSVFAKVSLARIHDLREIARRSHCPFRIRRRIGAPFVAAFFRKRPMVPLMAAAAVFLLSYISSFIFTLEVGGPYPVSAEDKHRVLDLAAEAGVAPGHSRWGMDLEAAQQYILLRFKELVFVEIVQKGVHLTIEVVKRVNVPPEDAIKEPGHLVATCDGIVEDILVRRGTAAVNSGDAVCRGDILIYGWQGHQAVAADGIVTANLWGEGYGECALEEQGSRLSGKSVLGIGIRIDGGSLLYLAGAVASPYEQYQISEETVRSISWRKTSPLVEVVFRKIEELMPYSITRTPEEARLAARERAAENAYADLLDLFDQSLDQTPLIIDKRIEDITLSSDPVRAHAVFKGRAKIGAYSPMSDNETVPQIEVSP